MYYTPNPVNDVYNENVIMQKRASHSSLIAASLLLWQAVNILRTAPYVCTMLIESCVAAPVTPNGKPAMPGSQSASAFYQPNRQEQMQPVMQRHPSLESQYSSMQQQFVPSQSHQIEDIVTVSSISSLDQTKPEKTDTALLLEKQGSNEVVTWVRPLKGNTAFVSAQIRERAMKKKIAVNKNISHGDQPKKCEEYTDNSPREGETSKDEQTTVSIVEHINTPWEEKQGENNTSQGITEGDLEDASVGENSQLLSYPQQQSTQNDDSNVFGFFKKIQSFLFAPSPPKPKRSESESSCCESDFDSEFSEMTSGSFNVGEIEAMRDELETLLLSGPPSLDIRVPSGTPPAMPRSQEEGGGINNDEDKGMFQLKEINDVAKEKKNAEELNIEIDSKEKLGFETDSGDLLAKNESLESIRREKCKGAGENSQVEETGGGKQEEACKGTECQFSGEKGEVKNPAKDVSNGKHDSYRNYGEDESQIYRTTSVIKIQKQTTV